MPRTFSLRSIGLIVLLMLVGTPALAGEATDRIKETTDKILAIVSNPALKTPEKTTERDRLIRKAVDERFDWKEMSRRALAIHWSKRTDDEKTEFIKLFGELLEDTYMDKVGGYSGEVVTYEGEKVSGPYGIVKVKILTQNDKPIFVKYRVKKKGKDWFVYDISIEGVSLINNYRKQFNSIINRSSYEDLVEKLKAKVMKNRG
ncbi:MAG: ABC transporter substrate-binding protein [Desulfatiglans sp.]|jgi:phospholipid transport system substrate-binding protein|nr:ABC transporter substrate-binding protein [Thermodesulfobacteriota bacterium]MEE4352379.1 ABC transporter substrate-binding protein [Desulfatiglans sp.]